MNTELPPIPTLSADLGTIILSITSAGLRASLAKTSDGAYLAVIHRGSETLAIGESREASRAFGNAIAELRRAARKEEDDSILVRTRTGSKIHVAYPGSSVTFCGHWLKAQSQHFRVRGVPAPEVRCERCANPEAAIWPEAAARGGAR